MAERQIPVALTIAGSDSGGGAGIEADLRAFWAHGVHGCAAVTALTAQNPFGVGRVQGTEPAVLRDQLERVADAFDLRAVKTGMLLNADLIGVVADFLEAHPGLRVVVDPVMVATSGARLLDEAATETLKARLLPLAEVVTPNLPESAVLSGQPIPDRKTACLRLAEALAVRYGACFLVKGGHSAARQSLDFWAMPNGTHGVLEGPVIPNPLTTHGTGCALSAAIAAQFARGNATFLGVVEAKAYVTNLLASTVPAGRAAVYGFDAPRYDFGDIAAHIR